MLAINVQETTTTTGTGNITLAGASEDGRTFNSQYSLNDRFTYYIDDRAGNFETGVGYLSGSTTLVRDKPLEGSSSLPVDFSAGEKQVFISPNNTNLLKDSLGFSDLSSTIKFMLPTNIVRINSSFALVSDRQYFMEAPFSRGALVDLIAVNITVADGTSANKMHIGLYEIDPLTGLAGNLLFEAANLDPSVSGTISGSFTEVFLQAGVYIVSVWCDIGITLKANDGTIRGAPIFASGTSLTVAGHNTRDVSSLSSLPDPAVTTTTNTNGKLINIAVGHT